MGRKGVTCITAESSLTSLENLIAGNGQPVGGILLTLIDFYRISLTFLSEGLRNSLNIKM